MSKSATSLLVYGSYLVVLGILFVVVPNPVIGLFGFPPASDVWIRVAGMLLIYLGTYDILAARKELTQFFRWSVYLRGSVILFFVTFVLLRFVQPMLLLFGAIDLLAAIWTAVTLRST